MPRTSPTGVSKQRLRIFAGRHACGAFLRVSGLLCASVMLAAASVFPVFAVPAAATAEDLPVLILPAGTVRAHDGDDLRSGKVRVRLWSIDAPELDQPCRVGGKVWMCGEAARDALQKLVQGKQVTCLVVGIAGRSGRLVAGCRVDGATLNEAMVRAGMAVVYHGSDIGRVGYAEAEQEAKAAKRGVWASEFEMPWDWRKR